MGGGRWEHPKTDLCVCMSYKSGKPRSIFVHIDTIYTSLLINKIKLLLCLFLWANMILDVYWCLNIVFVQGYTFILNLQEHPQHTTLK